MQLRVLLENWRHRTGLSFSEGGIDFTLTHFRQRHVGNMLRDSDEGPHVRAKETPH